MDGSSFLAPLRLKWDSGVTCWATRSTERTQILVATQVLWMACFKCSPHDHLGTECEIKKIVPASRLHRRPRDHWPVMVRAKLGLMYDGAPPRDRTWGRGISWRPILRHWPGRRLTREVAGFGPSGGCSRAIRLPGLTFILFSASAEPHAARKIETCRSSERLWCPWPSAAMACRRTARSWSHGQLGGLCISGNSVRVPAVQVCWSNFMMHVNVGIFLCGGALRAEWVALL